MNLFFGRWFSENRQTAFRGIRAEPDVIIMQKRKLSEEEDDELERLCISSFERELTLEEMTRIYMWRGIPEDDARAIAEAGGLPRHVSRAVDECAYQLVISNS